MSSGVSASIRCISLQQPIGSDLRPRSALETLGIGFLVRGPLIYCLKTKVCEDDPIWTALRSTGTEDVDSSSQRSGGDYSE